MRRQSFSRSTPTLFLFTTVLYLASPLPNLFASITPSGSVFLSSSSNSYIGRYADGEVTVDGTSTLYTDRTWVGVNSGCNGEITVTGPNASWENSDDLTIGDQGTGTLNILNGALVHNGWGDVGWGDGSTGNVIVDGSGSRWNVDETISIGWGTGGGESALTIRNGGAATFGGEFRVCYDADSPGKLHFENGGGTLTAQTLFASPQEMSGMGTIYARGIVSDVDLLFDSTHGLNQTLLFNGPGQDITIHLDLSNPADVGNFGAGHHGEASLTIKNGRQIECKQGYLAYYADSTTQATVEDHGSEWNSQMLYVGGHGNAILNIRNGADVHSGGGAIALQPASTSTVTVDGEGSTWTIDSYFRVGMSGDGTLNITNGADVSSQYGFIGDSPVSTSSVTVSGNGSTWTNTDCLLVGIQGNGTLHILEAGMVSNETISGIGISSGSLGTVVVDGENSLWASNADLYIGFESDGTLDIINGGLVSVSGLLTVDYDLSGNSFINMASGGMLALLGDADDSLLDFLSLVGGTDAIRWWNPSLADWDLLNSAMMGTDYTLGYFTEGDLDGYTLLTVTAPIPEPASLAMLIATAIGLLACRLLRGSSSMQ